MSKPFSFGAAARDSASRNDAFASAVTRQQSLSSRESQSFEPAVGAEFAENPLDVIPNRHARNGELPANPLRAYPLREKIQDLPLPSRQSPLLRGRLRAFPRLGSLHRAHAELQKSMSAGLFSANMPPRLPMLEPP